MNTLESHIPSNYVMQRLPEGGRVDIPLGKISGTETEDGWKLVEVSRQADDTSANNTIFVHEKDDGLVVVDGDEELRLVNGERGGESLIVRIGEVAIWLDRTGANNSPECIAVTDSGSVNGTVVSYYSK